MTTRLWWPLDELLPLARHAVAAPQHMLTRAQVTARAGSAPALIWTSTPGEDRLISNGVPAWHDQYGEAHRVVAETWQHATTGMRGAPRCRDDGDRYLPLLEPPPAGGRELFGLLRHGVRAGCHWLLLDLDPAGERLQVLDHRGDIAPADAGWVTAAVSSPSIGPGVYPAVIADGYTDRRGGVLARFDRATVEQLSADLSEGSPIHQASMPGEHPVLRLNGDVAVVGWEQDINAQTRLIEVDRTYPDASGRYAVGAYQWAWHRA